MLLYVSGILAALMFGIITGGMALLESILFAAAGYLLFRLLTGRVLQDSPYGLFALLVILGTIGDCVMHLPLYGDVQTQLLLFWCLFVPTLFLLFFARGFAGIKRKILCIAFLSFFMLLNIYAVNTDSSPIVTRAFLSGWLVFLFGSIRCTPRQKADHTKRRRIYTRRQSWSE